MALKVTELGVSYADVLFRAKKNVLLAKIDINNSRIRKAANGGILIEIPGSDGSTKADSLAGKLREALSGVAQVFRPIAKGEILLIGLDESVTTEEVITTVAKKGNCLAFDLKAGPISRMANGLEIVWLQCPITAIN